MPVVVPVAACFLNFLHYFFGHGNAHILVNVFKGDIFHDAAAVVSDGGAPMFFKADISAFGSLK